MHEAVILNCCSCDMGILVDIVQLIFAGLTTVFAFLAIAMARVNSMSDQKMSLLADRARMIEVYRSLMIALKTGLDKVLEKDVSERTDFQLGFEWFGDIIRLQNYARIARSLGYEKSENEDPFAVYVKGRDAMGNLVRQAHYLFSTGIEEAWEKLGDLFEKYGNVVSKPERLGCEYVENDERDQIHKRLEEVKDVLSAMERETRPTICMKPFSISMLQELFG